MSLSSCESAAYHVASDASEGQNTWPLGKRPRRLPCSPESATWRRARRCAGFTATSSARPSVYTPWAMGCATECIGRVEQLSQTPKGEQPHSMRLAIRARMRRQVKATTIALPHATRRNGRMSSRGRHAQPDSDTHVPRCARSARADRLQDALAFEISAIVASTSSVPRPVTDLARRSSQMVAGCRGCSACAMKRILQP